MTKTTPIPARPTVDEAERQVVGICLRYPEAVGMTGVLRGDDFPTKWLGQLFEASRLLSPAPERPGPWPVCEPVQWATTPLPDGWAAWLAEVENWRPRHAANLVGVNVERALELERQCFTPDALPRFIAVVRDAAKKDHLRLVAQTALSLLDHGSGAAEVQSVLEDALRTARAS